MEALKCLYIYEAGKVTYKSARTRSWEQAEHAAQDERDARDPVKIRLREIADREAAKKKEDAKKITFFPAESGFSTALLSKIERTE